MANVHGLTMEELGRLGIDERNNLYWDGKPLITRRKVTLPLFVNVAAVLAGLATALIAFIQFWYFWMELGWPPLW